MINTFYLLLHFESALLILIDKGKEDTRMGVEDAVAAIIDEEIVCKKCLKMDEQITMMRGFLDTISEEEAKEKEYICDRCNKKIPT